MRPIKAALESTTERMFTHELFEFFSKTPFWVPPLLFLPIIGIALGWSMALGVSSLTTILLMGLGVVIWTLLEYWLHRLVFHYKAKTAFGRKFIWYAHGVHHDWPNDKLRLVFPPAVSLPLAALFYGIFTLVFGLELRWAVFAGLCAGYLAYDMIHYFTHFYSFDSSIMKFLRSYHMAHHFTHEPLRYGVSNPLWDYVFGTAPRSGTE
ncbi:MAG: sterol desaturase family protein [Myxococcales bacterium]|nr:sterol desaturase family protein [Myxococcales bacterium]